MRRAIERFFGLRRLTVRDFALLFVALLCLSLLITFVVIKLVQSIGDYEIRYYDPRDIQREEISEEKQGRRR